MTELLVHRKSVQTIGMGADSVSVEITGPNEEQRKRLTAVVAAYERLRTKPEFSCEEFFNACRDGTPAAELDDDGQGLMALLQEQGVEVFRSGYAFEFAVPVDAEVQCQGGEASQVEVSTYSACFGSVFGGSAVDAARPLIRFSIPASAPSVCAELTRICGDRWH